MIEISKLQKALSHSGIVWRQHALTRMMERGISRDGKKQQTILSALR